MSFLGCYCSAGSHRMCCDHVSTSKWQTLIGLFDKRIVVTECTQTETVSNCKQTWILLFLRAVNSQSGLLWSVTSCWLYPSMYWKSRQTLATISAGFVLFSHVFSLSEPNAVAKALLQDFRRPQPKSYSAALGALTAQDSCWRQWGQEIPPSFRP